jgi:hypothetical protein
MRKLIKDTKHCRLFQPAKAAAARGKGIGMAILYLQVTMAH